jgi:hypothetical protein
MTRTKIEQCINLKFLVKVEKGSNRNEEAIDSLEDILFTENENSKKEQIASESNDYRFLQHHRCNL